MTAATIERDPETSGRTNRAGSAEKLKRLTQETHQQIDFLRRHQDNGKSPRTALIGRIASAIATVTIGRDLPTGYTDDADPLAAGALDARRGDLDELRDGDYPSVEPAPELQRIPSGSLRLSEFADPSRVVRNWSEVLAETGIFAGDRADFTPPPGVMDYRGYELEAYLGCSPDRLRGLHGIKKWGS